jgi:outer membrane protein OmpA-like peptidoglycan-associated protein
VNLESWDSQPCFSADGQTLYFASARLGGEGGSDIWSTRFIQDKGWTSPVNAGKQINTNQEEMAPFIHADGMSMYFSSKGHTGMGGFDLYFSRRDSTGNWMKPENLGWPVNTEADEINMVVSTNGKGAYLSSDLEDGYGGYDIYRFDLPVEFAPQKVSYLEGYVYDAETKKAVGAEIELFDLASGELSVRCASDPDKGYYIAALPGGKNYALNISKEGYLFYSENFNLEVTEILEEAVQKDVYLKPIKAGESFVLNNIFFDTDEYTLKDISLVELYKLNAFLVRNQGVNIMICGHTDDVGTAEYNQTLSENRAKSVFSFLVEHGITVSRLKFKGFGKSEPVAGNDTEEGRAENRRTEILILP